MGYNTTFSGVLKFTDMPLCVEELTMLSNILGEDVRDHPEWDVPEDLWISYVDLKTTPDLTGLKWSGDEKTYGMEHLIPLVIRLMRVNFPEFGLEGRLFAQGEEAGDVYYIDVDNDIVTVTSPFNDE